MGYEAFSRLKPFDVGRFLHLPGRKIYGISIEVSTPTPGMLERMAAVARELNTMIVYISYSTPREIGSIRGVVFMDFTDSQTRPEELLERLRRLPFVKKMTVIPPVSNSFVVDLSSFPITIGEERLVIFRESGYKALFEEIRRRIGDEAGSALLYHVGFNIGLGYGQSHRNLAEMLGLSKPKEVFETVTVPLAQALGFSLIEVLDMKDEPPYLRARVYRGFECEAMKTRGKPSSFMLRGMLDGILTSLYGVRMNSIELKCIAAGDPYCEYEAKPLKK